MHSSLRISLLILVVLFVAKISAFGSNSFYAKFLLTNQEFGSGATYQGYVWYSVPLQKMRIDYYPLNSNTKFMSVYFDYATRDQYQVCGTSCSRATYIAPMYKFQGDLTSFTSIPCETPDYPGPRACVASCTSYKSNPPQPQGIYSLSYTDSSANTLCLVRFTVQAGKTYGPEWQIQQYLTSGWTSQQDPTSVANYQSVTQGVNCPSPTCYAELDVALVIDESGSIFAANAWGDVQNFVLNLISGFTMGPGATRVGLAYFSGLDTCEQNWTGSAAIPCIPKDPLIPCATCGGRWQQLTPGVITSKSSLVSLVNSNNGAGGFTCISCGIDEGIKILNFAPKANVGKVIILLTDGAQNRVTDGLVQNAKYAYDQKISIIAIGVGPYKYSDLELFTTPDKIFTTANYNQLNTLISNIVTPLCQALPPIETCDFCSSLCACQAKCVCPSCDDFNACTDDSCDIRQPPLGTAGTCLHTTKTCNDGNICTVDKCNNSTGCDYSTPLEKPANLVDTFCIRYTCKNPSGYTASDIGASLCPTPSNKCIITYCNTTVGSTNVTGTFLTGSCQTINKTDTAYPYGTSITYKNSAGQTLTTAACGRPSNAPACAVYGCNPSNGQCTLDVSKCSCLSGSDCYDGNGCTYDLCTNGVCSNPVVDCYSILSNGQCTIGMPTAISNDLGDAYYNGTLNLATDFPLSGGLPSPATGVNRTCATLACYGAVRSSYFCSATNPTSFVCQRSTSTCTSTACSDSVCRSLNTWTNSRLDTNCGKTYARSCNDGLLCTSDVCNSAFTGTTCNNATCVTSSGGSRCSNPSNSSNCNDNKACTFDSCSNTTGCSNVGLPLPPTNWCLITGCSNSTGNFSTPNTTRCTSNDKCVINYCNTVTESCVQINKTALALGTNVTYVDSDGITKIAYGCNGTSNQSCVVYGCNPSTGNCFVDSSTCPCQSASDCIDGDGCTLDVCNATTGKCENPRVDCYSELSNGGCVANTAFTATNATGWSAYLSAITTNTSAPPSFVAGNYNCDQLACYGGQRSTYTCVQTSATNHTCRRNIVGNCQKGGCQDNICKSLGTWSNGQPNTDCSAFFSPTCNSDMCNLNLCNTDYIYASGSQRCLIFPNSTNCNDNSVCTTDTCDPVTGCVYTLKPPPAANTTCHTYTCDPSNGYQKNNVGPTNCPTSNVNKCWTTYCNTSTNTCQTIKKDEIPVGTTVTYVDSDGLTYSVAGCANPGDPVLCRQYGCDQSTGVCTQNITTCKCTSDLSCQDGTGCTIDKCDYVLNQCNRTVVDCYNLLSNGQCNENQTFAVDIQTGLNIYYRNDTNNRTYSQVDSDGLPFPKTGVSRTCAQLACYNGQQSQYTCFSLVEGVFTCQRNYLNCSRNGCIDNICRSLGTWTDGQMDTDCNTTYIPQCADTDACTNDFCNTDWQPEQNVTQRCLHIPVDVPTFCSDGNFCTEDYCDSKDTTGNPCKHRLYSERYLRKNICKTNESLVCKKVSCVVNKCLYQDIICNGPNRCIFFTCNASTNGTCQAFPTGLYSYDKCGVCGGNGLSCLPVVPGNPNRTSIAVALGVGLSIGLCFALTVVAILTQKSYAMYNAIGMEQQGTVTNNPTHVGGDDHIDTSNYNN